jgi:hypothetical protein
VLVNVNGLPGVVDPFVAAGDGSQVAVLDHVLGQLALLGLVLVLDTESAKPSLFQERTEVMDIRGEQRC